MFKVKVKLSLYGLFKTGEVFDVYDVLRYENSIEFLIYSKITNNFVYWDSRHFEPV